MNRTGIMFNTGIMGETLRGEQAEEFSATLPSVLSNEVYERSNLTRLQLLYWIGEGLRQRSPLYNTILTFTISGPVDWDRFRAAFQRLVEKTEVLRTVIQEIDGVPQRIVQEQVAGQLDWVDFSEEGDPQAVYRDWLAERKLKLLRLDERLYDSALVKLGAERYVWYLNQHHLITDAQSFILVYKRLAGMYEQAQGGESLQDEQEGVEFEAYAAYERAYRSSERYQKAAAYWGRKLDPGPEPLEFYGVAPNKKTTRVKRVSYDLGKARSEKLRKLARQPEIYTVSEEMSLYNLFLGMLFVLLKEMSGKRRLGVVTPVHNRFAEKFRKTVGLVMEICPLQVEVESEDTLAGVVKKVKQETREVLGYYQYGSGLGLQRQAFEVMFNLHDMPALELAGYFVRVERVHPGHGSESLGLHVNDDRELGSLVLHFDFHEELFGEAQQEEAVQSYLDLLDALLSNPQQRVGSFSEGLKAEHIQQEVAPPDDKGYLAFDDSDHLPPKDLLELKLLQIWQELLGHDSIGVTDSFFDLGGNSWLAVRLFSEIENVIGRYLPLNTLLSATTINDLAEVIRGELGEELWSKLITIQPGSDKRLPIFFVPGAGGNGLAVARIARHLSREQAVYMFQIPVGDGDESQFISVEEMAQRYLNAMQKVQPEGPYLVAGYSAGGLIALEICQQLHKQGQFVPLLVVIDVPAQNPAFCYLRGVVGLAARLLRKSPEEERKAFLYLRDLLFRFDYFQNRGFFDKLRRVIEKARRKIKAQQTEEQSHPVGGPTPTGQGQLRSSNTPGFEEVNSEDEGDLLWKSFDQHMQERFDLTNEAVKYYVPQRYQGAVTLFRSTIGYRRPEMRMADPYLGWRKIVRGKFQAFEVPGNHMQIVRGPSVRILGQQLEGILEEIQQDLADKGLAAKVLSEGSE